jgi:hypothetical protein
MDVEQIIELIYKNRPVIFPKYDSKPVVIISEFGLPLLSRREEGGLSLKSRGPRHPAYSS